MKIKETITNDQKNVLVDTCKKNKVSQLTYYEWTMENFAKSIN